MIATYALRVVCVSALALILFLGGVAEGSAVGPAADNETMSNQSRSVHQLDYETSEEPPPQSSLSLSPSVATMTVGDAPLQFTATYNNADYSGDVTEYCIWSSSNESVGTMKKGIFTPMAPGYAEVNAVYRPDIEPGTQAVTATASVTVNPPARRLTTITVQPPFIALDVGETRRLEATCLDENDNPLTDIAVSWESSDDAVAAVDPDGNVAGVSEGSAEITASADGVSEFAAVQVNRSPRVPTTIKVSPLETSVGVGGTLQLNATCFDQYGEVMPGVVVTWSSSDPAVGSVDSAGLFDARAVGTTAVTASADEAQGSATINVTEPTLNVTEPEPASIVVSPSSTTLGVGDTMQLEATVYGRDGRELSGPPVSWTSGNGSVGTIDDSGVFTAGAEGESVVTARVAGVEGTAVIRVSPREPPAPLARIVVSPETVTLGIGATHQFTATCYDRNDRVVEGVDVTWASSDERIGVVDADGLFTANNTTGNATVTASAEGVVGSASVTVDGGTIDPVLLLILATVAGATASYAIRRYLKGRPRTRGQRHLPVRVEVQGGVETAKTASGPRLDVNIDVTGGILKGDEER